MNAASLQPRYPVLPLDVLQIVSEDLVCDYDYDDLRACALVHRLWTRTAQKLLFHKVVIWEQETWDILFDALLNYPHLRDLVIELVIRCPTALENHLSWPTCFPSVCSVSFLQATPISFELLDCLPALSSLHVQTSHLRSMPCPMDNDTKYRHRIQLKRITILAGGCNALVEWIIATNTLAVEEAFLKVRHWYELDGSLSIGVAPLLQKFNFEHLQLRLDDDQTSE
jgi:hypothetical protein